MQQNFVILFYRTAKKLISKYILEFTWSLHSKLIIVEGQ